MSFSFRLFGLDLESDLPLVAPLGGAWIFASAGNADLVLRDCEVPPAFFDPDRFEPIYESPFTDDSGGAVLRIYRHGGWDLLRFPSVADFYIGQREILCCPADGCDRSMLGIRLLGTVLAFWLERSGIPTLHASAVAIEGKAIAFVAASGSGKTSLALSLLERGAALITDDILALDAGPAGFGARPAYSQLRLWPDLAQRYVDDAEALPRVNAKIDKRWIAPRSAGFGCETSSQPLAALYLPQRREGPVEIVAAAPGEALIELLRHSFLHCMPAAMGWEERRLEALGRLVESVPVLRLRYPSGWENLPAVAQALQDRLTKLPS